MKNISKLLLIAGLTASMGAMAAGTSLTKGGSTTIAPADCGGATTSLLGSSVQINLSANVNGAYSCDFATTGIKIATCHETGSRAAKSGTCTVTSTTTPPGGGDPVVTYNDPTCSEAGTSFNYTDRTAFVASNAGGSVAVASMQGAACTSEAIGSHRHFSN